MKVYHEARLLRKNVANWNLESGMTLSPCLSQESVSPAGKATKTCCVPKQYRKSLCELRAHMYQLLFPMTRPTGSTCKSSLPTHAKEICALVGSSLCKKSIAAIISSGR